MSIVKEPWFVNGLAEYKATELAVKRFWRAAIKRRKHERAVERIALNAVEEALK